jgi:hypothetical protein
VSTARPDWDLLIAATTDDSMHHSWFPAKKIRLAHEFTSLEGMRFRNVYLTNAAIEKGSYALFQILYFNARITGGKVLHVSDYQED